MHEKLVYVYAWSGVRSRPRCWRLSASWAPVKDHLEKPRTSRYSSKILDCWQNFHSCLEVHSKVSMSVTVMMMMTVAVTVAVAVSGVVATVVVGVVVVVMAVVAVVVTVVLTQT